MMTKMMRRLWACSVMLLMVTNMMSTCCAMDPNQQGLGGFIAGWLKNGIEFGAQKGEELVQQKLRRQQMLERAKQQRVVNQRVLNQLREHPEELVIVDNQQDNQWRFFDGTLRGGSGQQVAMVHTDDTYKSRAWLQAELDHAELMIAQGEGEEKIMNKVEEGFDELKGVFVNQLKNAQEIQKLQHQVKIQGDQKLKEIAEENKTKVEAAKQSATAYIQGFFDNFRDKKTVAVALTLALGMPGLYYVARFSYEYALRFIGKPSLVRETSTLSFNDWLKEQLGLAKEKPPVDLSDIVLSPDLQSAIEMLAEDTKETAALGLKYRNALLYGPPGTGKTEFAKMLSYYSGMQYAIMSGADFNQFDEGERIAKLHELFDWAEKTKGGLIIFIDEADACLRDRSTLSREAVALVNAFLSRTGSSSDKFMVILATNYPEELDQAVRSRIHAKYPFPLPGIDERIQILKKKFEKTIVGDSRSYHVDGEEVTASLVIAPEVDEEYLKAVAGNLDGFSGRDIAQMVDEVKLRAYRSGQNAVTKEIMEYVVSKKRETIEQDKKTTEYQRQRSEAARKKMEHVAQENV